MSRRARAVLAAGGLAVLAILAASIPWCRRADPPPARVVLAAAARGALRAGAAEQPLQLTYPLVLAGYGPPRPVVTGATRPLYARAVVLEVGAVRFGLVSLDLLTLPESVDAELRHAAATLGLTDVWAMASHSHSSIGGYEQNLMHQLAGSGRFRPAVHRAVVDAGVGALRAAVAGLRPASAEVGAMSLAGQVVSRNEVRAVDDALSVVRLRDAEGPIAELLLLSAHPTLRGRRISLADPDYPGVLSEEEHSRAQAGITLVLQGAMGNAHVEEIRESPEAPQAFAARIEKDLRRLHAEPVAPMVLGVARASTALPSPDASRLVPPWARGAGANFICANAPATAAVGVLQLGPLRWVSLPGEPTQEAALEVEEAAKAQRVAGVANGYLGYIEAAARVPGGGGESRRQYFDARLASVLAAAAHVAATALEQPLASK